MPDILLTIALVVAISYALYRRAAARAFSARLPEGDSAMWKRPIYRQGDVVLRKIAKVPNKTRVNAQAEKRDEQGRVVLAYGETTGHAHALVDPGVVAWGIPEAPEARYLTVPKSGATLRHEEHAPIEVPPGDYAIVRQRVYDPFTDTRRWVED